MTRLNRKQKRAGSRRCKAEGRHIWPDNWYARSFDPEMGHYPGGTCRRCSYQIPRSNPNTWGLSLRLAPARSRAFRPVGPRISWPSFFTPRASWFVTLLLWIGRHVPFLRPVAMRGVMARTNRRDFRRMTYDFPRVRGRGETWLPKSGKYK